MGPVLSIVMPFAAGAAAKPEIDLALACLTAIDVYEIRKYGLPPLLRSGAKYRREVCLADLALRETCERFLSARMVNHEGFGDCDDFAPYQAADMIVHSGIRARAIAVPSPGVGWHCVTALPDGSIVDPSKLLGMGKR